MHILIVDNEPEILNFLRKLFQQEGYVVDTTRLIETALKKIRHPYNFIILGISPLDKKSVEFCEILRAAGIDTPILILSYLDATADKIDALNKGADDYLSKPFNPKELLARVNSILRRQCISVDNVLQTETLSLNTKTYEVKRDGLKICLPGKQFALLQYLLARKGKIVPKDELIAHLYGNRSIKSNALEVIIRRLRRSINRKPRKNLIETIYGVGYKISSI